MPANGRWDLIRRLKVKKGELAFQVTPCCRCVASVNKPTEMRRRENFQNIFTYNLPVTGCHGHTNAKLTFKAFKMNF